MFCVDRLIHSKEAKGNNNEVEKEIQDTPSHTVVVVVWGLLRTI
jgi:hypothetical protein